MKILIPVSIGELYDKLSILEIKLAKIPDQDKLVNVSKEYNELSAIANQCPIDDDSYKKLKQVNNRIWDIEDGIRIEEKNKDYGEDFIELARLVYFNNDLRAKIKITIDIFADNLDLSLYLERFV